MIHGISFPNLVINAITLMPLLFATPAIAFDQGELQKSMNEMLYGKPIPKELNDPTLSPAELQKRQIELQQKEQKDLENRKIAKENRKLFLYDISYTAFLSLKNEGVLFDRVQDKIDDVIKTNDSKEFAFGNKVIFSSYENPTYFCPKGSNCIRIDSFLLSDTLNDNCKYRIGATRYIPDTIPGWITIGEWPCDKFAGDAVKEQAVDSIRKYAISQMRGGVVQPSGPASELFKQGNKDFEAFFGKLAPLAK